MSEETCSSEREVAVEEIGKEDGDLSLCVIFRLKAMMPKICSRRSGFDVGDAVGGKMFNEAFSLKMNFSSQAW